jgi:hypothetical protein
MVHRVHLSMSGIRTQNISGHDHFLHRLMQLQLPYDHEYDGRFKNFVSAVISEYSPRVTFV